MNRRVLTFPASMHDELFGVTETNPVMRGRRGVTIISAPTIPPPKGGWGIPAVDEDTGNMMFSVHTEHINPTLADFLRRNAAVKNTRLRTVHIAPSIAVQSEGGEWVPVDNSTVTVPIGSVVRLSLNEETPEEVLHYLWYHAIEMGESLTPVFQRTAENDKELIIDTSTLSLTGGPTGDGVYFWVGKSVTTTATDESEPFSIILTPAPTSSL
jgi:hypothetical protein